MNPLYISSLFGGVLIGSGAALLLFSNGKIAGISGMVGNILWSGLRQNLWRGAFVFGLIFGGFSAHLLGVPVFERLSGHPTFFLIAAGLLVGFGTQLGSGCTSGHGVCGIARLSWRSIFATLTFMGFGAATVYFLHHVMGL